MRWVTRFRLVVVSVVLFGSSEDVSVSGQFDPCLTPNRESGYCLIISQCQPLFGIVKRRPVKQADIDFLRNSQCGFDGKYPKVCCPLRENYPVVGETRKRTPVPRIIRKEELCYTPREVSGQCVVISECAPLYAILQNRPIKPTDVDYLRRSQCGFQGTLPRVCCPKEEEKPTSTTPVSAFGGGDVTPITTTLLPGPDVCGISTDDKIYGGEQAALDEFPWMALIEYEKPNRRRGFYCGGVLINNRYILTAAHCLKGKDLPPTWKIVSVRLGEYNTETETDCVKIGPNNVCAPPALDVAVEERISHEDYNPYDINQYHDIALLRLVRSVKFNDFVRPICLPKSETLLKKEYTGNNLIVAGWGKTENKSESNIKLKLEVPVNNNKDCVSRYSAANVNLDSGQLCAGGRKGRDSCRGDSGGPLMAVEADGGEVNWYSVGVVSFGPSPCGMENWPGVYTRVARYVGWIVDHVRP